jgi:hypothetical protein
MVENRGKRRIFVTFFLSLGASMSQALPRGKTVSLLNNIV